MFSHGIERIQLTQQSDSIMGRSFTLLYYINFLYHFALKRMQNYIHYKIRFYECRSTDF